MRPVELRRVDVGSTSEVETETGGGATDDDNGRDTGGWFPVPTIVLDNGTGVTVISVIIVVVRTISSALDEEDDDGDKGSGGLKSDRKNEERSGCLDCKSAVLVLVLEVDDEEDVGGAGAVELVTICRFTCRGK